MTDLALVVVMLPALEQLVPDTIARLEHACSPAGQLDPACSTRVSFDASSMPWCHCLSQVREEQKDIPVCTLDDLRAADGVLVGWPTRYGNMTAQMKQLIDSTASLWLKGEMEGKPAGVFTCTASTHGGQETTLVTMMIPLLHLGMLIVGVPYSVEGMLHTQGRGSTPYGATTIAGGQGELQPKPEDLAIARALGRRVAEITARVRG